MSTEVTLTDQAFFRAIKDGAPFFEFANAIGRLLRVKLCHAPNVEEFAAAHRVAEVHFPVVA